MHWFQWWLAVSTIHRPCGFEGLSACDITRIILAKKSLSGGFCLPPKNLKKGLFILIFALEEKQNLKHFMKSFLWVETSGFVSHVRAWFESLT